MESTVLLKCNEEFKILLKMHLLDRFTEINWITLSELSTFSAHCLFGLVLIRGRFFISVYTDSQPVSVS